MGSILSFARARGLAVVTAALGVLALSPPGVQASTASLPTVVGSKHVMWAAGQGYPSTQQASTDNLIYHGGLVETVPAVYIVYWGPEWQQGFVHRGGFTYTNKTVQNYVGSFSAALEAARGPASRRSTARTSTPVSLASVSPSPSS